MNTYYLLQNQPNNPVITLVNRRMSALVQLNEQSPLLVSVRSFVLPNIFSIKICFVGVTETDVLEHGGENNSLDSHPEIVLGGVNTELVYANILQNPNV